MGAARHIDKDIRLGSVNLIEEIKGVTSTYTLEIPVDDFVIVEIVETAGDPDQLRAFWSTQNHAADASDAPIPGDLFLGVVSHTSEYLHFSSTETPYSSRTGRTLSELLLRCARRLDDSTA